MTATRSRAADWILVGAALAGLIGGALDLAGNHSPLRTVTVVAFLAVAPTVAIAGLLHHFDPFARIILAFTANVALVALLAMVLLSQGAWSPGAGLIAMAAITALCLVPRYPRLVRALPRPPSRAPATAPPRSAPPRQPPAAREAVSQPPVPRVVPPDGTQPAAGPPIAGPPIAGPPIAELGIADPEIADLIRVGERMNRSADAERRRLGQLLLARARDLEGRAGQAP